MTRSKIFKIKQLLEDCKNWIAKEVSVHGWLKTLRHQKNLSFLEINDGSCFQNLQILVDRNKILSSILETLSTGCSLAIMGTIQQSPGKNQLIELSAQSIQLYGFSDPESYPLQKKQHTFEFLRTIAHLRPRTNTQGAVARIRNALSFATHKFFHDRNFLFIPTPIITESDCEGAGELFQVTTLKDPYPRKEDGTIDHSKDFFGKEAYLTVSGQLNAEAYSSALCDVYTFGPTFRAEHSHTPRHLAEFWMIEPEMAFSNLDDDIKLAEDFLKYVTEFALSNCKKDIEFLNTFIEQELLERLHHVIEKPFERILYSDAIKILENTKKSFEFPISWGMDLQTEHERYLTEEYFHCPVVVTDYPKNIKAFYMRLNEDNKTVAAMDILVPKIGEIVGGSQREERLEVLEQKMDELKIPKERYWWYLELRKYGTVPHAGFGVGFERLLLYVTGMENIRDVVPFPRVFGSAEF